MQRIALSSRKSKRSEQRFLSEEASIDINQLQRYAEGWILDCEIRQHSKATLAARRQLLKNFWWYCEKFKVNIVDRTAIRQFLAYAASDPPEGRWDNLQETGKISAGTIATKHRILRALINWIAGERGQPLTIMANIAAPVDRPDQIIPFTREQVVAFLEATEKTEYAPRNLLILRLLFDTGLRVSELCSIKISDIDQPGRCFIVVGKGNKKRVVNYGSKVASALWKYLRTVPDHTNGYLFRSERGIHRGGAFTRSGVEQLIKRLAILAGIDNVRASPHTFRHTFAIEFLRNGGDQFSLMNILGHTDTKMTGRYVNMARADVAKQHRRFSPMDNLK